MELKTIREKKQKLAKEVADLFIKFTQETQTEIDGASLSANFCADSEIPISYSVAIDIIL